MGRQKSVTQSKKSYVEGELHEGITCWTEMGCTGLGQHSNFFVLLGLENSLNLIKYTFLKITKMQFWATFVVEISREETNKSPNVAPLRLDINSCLKHKKRWKQDVD